MPTWPRRTMAGLVPLCLLGLVCGAAAFDVLDYVDPLIGTMNGGHVFPGATLPFGMAKAVADVNTETQGGFASDNGDIVGFSHMHDSGTGGRSSLGNFPLFPQTGCPGDELNRCLFTKADRASQRINSTVAARPGYFAVALNTSVLAEMTVGNHSALYRFTFPAANSTASPYAQGPPVPALPLSPLVLLDLTDLSDTRQDAAAAVDAATGRITASGTFQPSFGVGNYTLHACVDFHGAAVRDAGVFANNRAGSEPQQIRVYADGVSSPPTPAGAWVRFRAPSGGGGGGGVLLARVGLSFQSTTRACSNAEAELGGWDFAGTRAAAEAAWRAKLGAVAVDAAGVGASLQRTFWSGVYRALLSPQDYTGENRLWASNEPYYDSYYCIWDSFRSVHPLITLVDPVSQARMVRSLIDIFRHEGKLPDCRMSLCKGYTQGGSNADVVLADALAKGLGEGQGIDWATGYAAVVSDAEDEPAIWSVEGRGGLASWKRLGYIPTDDFDPNGSGPVTRSISRTVEYAYNDFCIGQMAAALNHTADAAKYAGRAGNWRNMLNPAQVDDSGFRGFLQPRYLNGTFGVQDPTLCMPRNQPDSCFLDTGGHETYEGSAWLYTLYAPHDMAGLAAALGGRGALVARLLFLHQKPGQLDMGDEQAFLPVFLFHYGGRPGLSARTAHSYIPSHFNDTSGGLTGNDDSGAMGAFIALAMMGLWPVAGQDVYLISAPFFREVNVTNGLTGRTATVRVAEGFDGDAYANVYIQSARLNGEAYGRNWISHALFRDGGVLELVLGPRESAWGTGEADLPPSVSRQYEG